MKRSLRAALGASIGVLALAAPAAPAGAQSTPAPKLAAERALTAGREGLELYTAQRWAECAARFAEAEALTHSPVFRLYLGRCQRGAGKLLAAREELRAVSSEPLPDGAPVPWRQAKTDATAELGLLERAIPSVRLSLEGGDAATTKLRVGAIEARVGVALELDPGAHEASAERADGELSTQRFELAEGQKELEVRLRFGDAPSASQPEPAPRQGVPIEGDEASSSGGLVPGLVLIGAGGVALSVGAVLGGFASGAYDGLRDEGCGTVDGALSCGGTASAAQQSDFDAANTLADASTGLFIAGGVTAAVGLVVLIAFPGESAPLSARGSSLVWRF